MPTVLTNGDNFSKVDRRLLLFQVDLGNKDLNTVLSPRGLSDSRAPQDSVRLSDPVDYDDPSSPIYWRKVSKFPPGDTGNSYSGALQEQFSLFLSAFQRAISDRTIKLKTYGPSEAVRPYVDISDFTKSISDYSVRVDQLDNKITVVLARPESTDLVSGPSTFDQNGKSTDAGQIIVNFNDDVFGQLNPVENDIIVVKSAYSPADNFDPEFIGMVTKVTKSFGYGRVDSFTLEVAGLSKILYTTQMIKSKAVRPQEFIPGVELNSQAEISNYQDNFNSKDVRGVFRYILSNALSCKEIDQSTATFLYRLDPSVFVSFEAFGFQHNIYVLLALYLMSVTEAPDGAEGSLEQRLFPQSQPQGLDFVINGFINDARAAASKATVVNANGDVFPVEPRTAKRPLLDSFIRGVLERGNHEAYNTMARQGVEKFFSQMAHPGDILGEVRSNSYSDIFESRDGIIVCRPPRYNKVERTQSETWRVSGENNFSEFLTLSPNRVWEFKPTSDFVIRSEELQGIGSIAKDEMGLESRIDVKAIFPYAGEKDYPTALYVDADILFRYGLRSHGAVSNPNAYGPKLAKLFAPIALSMVNAPTRTIEITVKDTRKFFVGKLYYIEAIDMVAYLVGDTINHAYGSETTRSLSFTMLRQVVRRPIAEILRSPEEVLNVGMMFTTDFPDQAGLDKLAANGFQFEDPTIKVGPVKPTMRALMYTKGKLFLEDLKKNSTFLGPNRDDFEFHAGSHRDSSGAESGLQSKSDVRLVMFKYIPSIEDLIMEIETAPQLVTPPAKSKQDVPAQTKVAKNERLNIYIDPADFLYYTAGFKNSEPNEDRLRYVQLIQDISREPIEKKRINLSTPSLTDPLNINYATTDKRAPMSMAGLIGYVFPTVPDPGDIEVKSKFIEVPGGAPVSFFKSPFYSGALSDQPTNNALSQVLMNKLVDIDLDMKFTFDPDALIVNPSGIQQYYYLAKDKFVLFGSSCRPSDYLSNLIDNVVVSQNVYTVSQFQNGILKSVGTLKLNSAMSAFENDFFSIPITDSVFDLPFGHLVLKYGNKPGEMGFFRVYGSAGPRDGGKFKITPSPTSPNAFLIEPMDSTSRIEDQNTGIVTGQGEKLEVASPNGLYFMSPFMEPTIERLLDIYIPPKFGGNLTATEADKQKKLSSKGVLISQAKRQNGQAINMSIDALLLASKSNIEVVGGTRPLATPIGSTGSPAIYQRFESQALRSFNGNGMTILPILNALKGNLVLPDGTNLGPKNLMIYTFQVEEFVENKYASRLQNSSVAATVGA